MIVTETFFIATLTRTGGDSAFLLFVQSLDGLHAEDRSAACVAQPKASGIQLEASDSREFYSHGAEAE
ncbi:MAG: hypothetical protein ABSC47_06755 [Terracidiphilus sp.]|jgi:hypothetical protein